MRHKKNIIIITMCIAVFIMGIGYALLSTQIDISGSTAVTSTWQVEFSAIRTASMKGGATNKVTPSITNTSATFEVDLVSPGDEIVYEIDITNYGDIDAQVTGATYAISGSEAIYVEVEGVRKGTVINSCENLEICPTITLKLTVGYDPNVSKDPEEKTKDIEFTIDVSQYVEDNPVEDAPLIPDLVEYVTLPSQILMDNTVQGDGVIDFSQPSKYIASYSQNLGTSTASTTFTASTTYYFATSYTFNATTGLYSLAGTKTSGTWSSMSSTYSTYPYTCKSTSSTGSCSTLYKMSSYSSTTAGYAYSYTRTANYKDNGNGLFVTSVNTEGGKPTYYFRGDVDNNYVKFGKQSVEIRCTYNGNPVYDATSENRDDLQLVTDKTTCETGNVCYSRGTYLLGTTDSGNDDYNDCNGSYWMGSFEGSATWNDNSYNDIYWRIVRINEDGSIRLIIEDSIGISAFNSNTSDNAHVGYMYGTSGSSTYEATHKNTNNSTIKTYIDDWYVNDTNLSSLQSNYLADAGFCNDRSVAPKANVWTSNDKALGYGTNTTYYGSYYRLSNTKTAKFECPQKNDLFTTNLSSKGNKALNYPIGLISIDEAVYAGHILGKTNYNMYLGQTYFWSMSPAFADYGTYYAAYINSNTISYQGIGSSVNIGVRPVINLKQNVTVLSGNGTAANPYIINMN